MELLNKTLKNAGREIISKPGIPESNSRVVTRTVPHSISLERNGRLVRLVGMNDGCRAAVDCCCRVLVYHSSFPRYDPRDTFYDRRGSDLVQSAQHVTNVITSLLNHYYLHTLRYVTRLLEDLTVKVFQAHPCCLHRMPLSFDPGLHR